MSNLYLVDQPLARSALPLAAEDGEALVVLIQDGVYADVSTLIEKGGPLFAVRRDVERRGLSGRLPGAVRVIDFPELVDLIVNNKIVNFA